ncbi:hypothetical protein DMN91_012776 [Ooceraea biroi]|uniref:Uncharacterized protein n=1 Tax=Ooceraea biroi TaxID=2015173 RepID=A0A026W4I4_OOCBI|nr:uncharacterized protein LOC113563343 [Ooceraea biroi]EZA50962.1 hypothetical protein X777_10590 [Ooceraea biroi]RLU14889.1 hypothetical protein DMN91_012776 [Ooceraea biroi]
MSCFGGHDEQIYLIEILIDKLTLTPGKIKDIAGHPIVIKIKLLDFPVFEFTRGDSDASRRDQDVSFMIGKCYMFIKRPRDLVGGLRSTCMKIGVFRAGDTYPTAESELTLPGCLCDQIGMIGNDPENQPKPFAVKGGFHLLDPGENPSGTLHMELIVVCLGRSFLTHYELHPKSVSGEEDKEREICVKRFVPPEYLYETIPKEPHEKITLPTVPERKAKAKKKGAKVVKKKKVKK